MPWRIGLYKERRGGLFGTERRLERITALDVLGAVLDSRRAEDDVPELPVARSFDSLCGMAGGVLIVLVLGKLFPGLFGWTYHATHNIGENIIAIGVAIIWWLVRVGIVIGLSGALIYKILGAAPGARWVAYPLVALAYTVFMFQGHGFSGQRAGRQTAAASFEAAQDAAQAREQQLLAEDAERKKLVAQRDELTRQLGIEWRADVASAGATAAPGRTPPMLKVTELREQAQVMNLTDSPLYLCLSRVRTSADGHQLRCLLDAGNVVRFGPHGTHRFIVFQTGNINPEACKGGQLEFRVGTVNDPEPSWWTQTALEDFAQFAPPPVSLADNSLETLRTQVADLQRRLADSGRADRWRAALAARR